MLCIGPQVCAIARLHGTMQASSPTKHRAGFCQALQDISLRKAAMHPSVCALRRIQLPLQGSLSSGSAPQSLPCKGRCRRRRRRGAAPGPAIILSGRRSPCVGADALHRPASLRHRRAHGTMQASSPTDARQSPARVWKMCGAPSGAAAQKQPRTGALGAGLFCRDAGGPFGSQRPADSGVAVSETAASGVAGGASASSPRRHSRCSSSGICSAAQVPSSCCVISSSISS